MPNKFIVFLNNTHFEKIKPNIHNSNFLENLKNMLNPFFWRKDEVFYDADFIEKLCEEAKEYLDLDAQFEYLTGFEDMLGDILKNANIIDFKENGNTQDYYFLWKLQNVIEKEGLEIDKTDKNNILLHILSKQNKSLDTKNIFLLAFFPFFDETIYTKKSEITIIKDNYDKNELPEIYKIPFVKDENSAFECIKKYRTPINFHLNPKHGENGKNAKNNKGENVAILYCSKEEASEMLQSAFMTDTHGLYYDQNHQKFIVFQYEGNTPQNKFHAFHLENEQAISKQAKKFPDDLVTKLKIRFNLI